MPYSTEDIIYNELFNGLKENIYKPLCRYILYLNESFEVLVPLFIENPDNYWGCYEKLLNNESELYRDLQDLPLEIIGIVNEGHRDFDETMSETLYTFKIEEHRMFFTLYESEL